MTAPGHAPGPAPARRRLDLRRLLGWLFVAAAVVMALTAAGSVAVSALLSTEVGEGAEPVLFTAGEEVVARDAGPIRARTLVVYGRADPDGSTNVSLGCTVTGRDGTERVVGPAVLNRPDDITTSQGRLVPLETVETWFAGDVVICDSADAAASEPLALGVDSGFAGIGTALAGVFAVICLVFGAACLVVGVLLLRRRS